MQYQISVCLQKGKVFKILRSTYFCTVSFLQILSAANVLRNEFLNELSVFNLAILRR